jgi:bacteriocin biosynthesis cyclodehydratase domain-containing protein
VGPLVVPRESACLACYNAGLERLGDLIPNAPGLCDDEVPLACELAPLPALVASLAAAEAVKFLSRALDLSLVGRQVAVDLVPFAFRIDAVTKVPRCPACGLLREHAPMAAFEGAGAAQ